MGYRRGLRTRRVDRAAAGTPVTVRMLVCGLMGAARLIELVFSRRNIQENSQSAEGMWSRRTFPLIVALHTAVITGTLLRGGRVRLPWLFLLMAAQPLRAWVLLSLGDRKSTRL